jgi:serine/threonine protein kinase
VNQKISPLLNTDPASIGEWKLSGRLGQGGYGTIFLASKDKTQVALKMISKEWLSDIDAEGQQRFANEAKILKELNHPNIAKIIDQNLRTNVPYIAIEYLEGQTLESKIQESGPLPESEWFEYLKCLLSALEYCHSKNIIHKDLSPTNIIITDRGPKLIDFGNSFLKGSARLTQAGVVNGTPGYMSPEHYEGNDLAPEMDLFSLASVLAYAGTGQPAFTAQTKQGYSNKTKFEAPELSKLNTRQQEVLLPLFYKDPKKRPSFYEINKAIEELMLGKKLTSYKSFLNKSSEKIIATPTIRYSPKTRIKQLLLFVTLATIFTVGFILFLQNSRTAQVISLETFERIETSVPSSSPPANEALPKGSKPTTCNDFFILNNVEADVLRTCQLLIKNGNLNGYYNIGFYYYEQGETKKAISWWQNGADKKSALSMYRLAGVLYENGELSQAKKWYQACVEVAGANEGKSWCMNGLGKIYYQEKDMKESRRWYQMSADLGDQEGYYRVGMNYAGTKEWQKALDNYLKILNPKLGPKTLIAEAYSNLGNQDQALVWYNKAAEDGSADALVNVGAIYYTKKDFPNAIKSWRKASELGSGPASYKLARLYVDQGKTEEAEKFDKVGASQGEIGSIFFYAFSLQNKGDFKNAKIWYQKGVDKNDPQSMVQLGAILSAIEGDDIRACALWREASTLGNVKAKENVSNYCS